MDINHFSRIDRIDQALVGKFGPIAIDKYSYRCRPRLLVVTDGGLDFGQGGFGLWRFLEAITLGVGIIAKPIITLAHRGSAATPIVIGPDTYAVLQGFNFASSAIPVTIVNYDQIWMFGIDQSAVLNAAEIATVAQFMNAGGGVFSTGDHATLGAAMGSVLPRVRLMREWSAIPMGTEPVPLALERIDTITDPGSNNLYEFADQSDDRPQRIYPNYKVQSAAFPTNWTASLHPLLSTPSSPALRSDASGFTSDLDCLPDHPHESVCYAVDDPTVLSATFTTSAGSFDEWRPAVSGPGRTPAEIVAYAVSGGRSVLNGVWKPPVRPRMFGVISAYDGRAAQAYTTGGPRPGRIVCDSTWHHYVNINLDGTGSGRHGLGIWSGGPQVGVFAPSAELLKIFTYYRNIVTWLQPANRVSCRIWWYLEALTVHPFILEELLTPKFEKWSDHVGIGLEARRLLEASIGAPAFDDLVIGALHASTATEGLADALAQGAFVETTLDRDRLIAGVFGALLVQVFRDSAELSNEKRVQRFERGPEKALTPAFTKLPSLIDEAFKGEAARAVATQRLSKRLAVRGSTGKQES